MAYLKCKFLRRILNDPEAISVSGESSRGREEMGFDKKVIYRDSEGKPHHSSYRISYLRPPPVYVVAKENLTGGSLN